VALTDAELLDATDERAASQLISHADTAMYEAKTTGRGRCVLFTTQMQTLARERTQLAASLSHAIANFELDVVYQPVFSAVTQSAVAAEALVRWNHPVHGWVDPSTFVLVAEESGLVARLGEVVLQQSLTNLRVWITQQQVPDTFSVHVNVSPLQLASSSFVNIVLHLLRTAHLRPENLVLEARESALTSKNVDIERSIRALRRVGVRIAIDNFGTGANALSVLTEVGADYLKLDGALGLPSGASDSDTRVVRALVLLAHALGMEVVAERVSGIEQLRRLRAAGCDYVQGNLLGEPTSAGTFVAATSY
jgi:EAL domain-containing protein (putative c-di-GMP-specific phosphodiesterase class I)